MHAHTHTTTSVLAFLACNCFVLRGRKCLVLSVFDIKIHDFPCMFLCDAGNVTGEVFK